MNTERTRVLYLYAGKRKEFHKKWEKGLVGDTQLLGLNYMNELGVDAEFLEWPLAEWLRKVHFNLVHLPYLKAIRKYDVVFICAGLPLVFLAKYIFRWKKPKFVIYNTFLTNALTRNPRGIRGFITRKAVKSLDMIVCTAREQEKFLIEQGFDSAKIVFHPIGIDAQHFASTSIKISDNYIISVGRDPGRDYATLFEAIKDLPIRVKVATKKETIAGLEIPKNAQILLDVPYENMLALYQNALLAVVPLRDWNNPKGSDTSGQYGYLEPMASGKAVVVSNRSTVRDYIENGEDGILIPPGNSEALREALQKLISDEPLRIRLGHTAQKKVLEKFTSRTFASTLAEIFKKL